MAFRLISLLFVRIVLKKEALHEVAFQPTGICIYAFFLVTVAHLSPLSSAVVLRQEPKRTVKVA